MQQKATLLDLIRRYQIALAVIWLAASGGMAMERTLAVDPVLQDGRKCVALGKGGPDFSKLNDIPETTNPFELFVPGSPYYNPNGQCDRASLQAIIDLRRHPIPTVLGSLVPTLIAAPGIYLFVGWLGRRYNAQFKVCEHCAERIKPAAKICRYCGREVQ
ncbi:MAG TPA: hypothetical protein VMU69_06020 [Bradyrhizobium sp.]|nr:hypothetical protein [Bradyrhizobium sp.]